MASSDLEAPPGEDPNWEELYVARADEVPAHRPIFTGDVFLKVRVRATDGREKSRSVMLLQHPCTMRAAEARLKESLLVASLRSFPELLRSDWDGNEKCMPLPDARPGMSNSQRNLGAFFESIYLVHPDDLLAGERVACLSEIGVYLVLQRWMFHSSRLAVPTWRIEEANSHVYAEADLGESWGEAAAGAGVQLPQAARDFDSWLSEVVNGKSRREMLRATGQRSQVQRDMKQELKMRYQASGAGDA